MIRIRGVMFDLDGTLIHEEIDFAAIRRELDLPHGEPLLEALTRMSPGDREQAKAVLDRHEGAAAAKAVAIPGVEPILRRIDEAGLRRGILTRNSRPAAEIALAAAGLSGFDPVLTRDDAPAKPDPGGILIACELWQVAPAEVVMVGDYVFDVQAGRAAGCPTILVTHGRDWPFAAEADLVIRGYDDWPVGVVSGGRLVL
ncbi:MAG: HAD family hydrolase [Gemmataceae bacterium]|nr:HAD family hydrolase [Gemmataceae bacterium]